MEEEAHVVQEDPSTQKGAAIEPAAKTETLTKKTQFSPFLHGIFAVFLCFLLDQASKLALVYGTEIRLTYPWEMTRFLDFTVVWNYGISYGLFQQGTELGRWILVAFKLLASVFLFFWLKKAKTHVESWGIGLILGGALGNALDRIQFGAVFDFLHFHIGEWSWYVFNIADAGIVIGVMLLFFEQFFGLSSSVIFSSRQKNTKK